MNLSNLDFQQARIKYILFKSKVRAAMFGGTFDSTTCSATESPIGKWIYTVGLVKYKYIPEMQELEKINRTMHSFCEDVMNLYKKGRIEEARDEMKNLDKYAEQFTAVLERVEAKAKRL